MAHLPRFHRRRKDAAPPALDIPSKPSLPPGDAPSNSPTAGSPMRSLQKLSPFRVFHRSSGKRARDSPPASLPHSPVPAPVAAGDGADGCPVSPLSLKTDLPDDEGQKPANPPKMPAFLHQTYQEMQIKFSELAWREHGRLAQSIANPSPDFRWARVSGPHLKVLDRYMNVQPWHNNRIKLQVPDGQVDYINASPIVLMPSRCPTADGRPCATREPDRYIAMQGPKRASMDHVWRMVVEQLDSPGVIVMLTETHEGHMEKCFPYFPRSENDPPIEVNERDEFGDGFRATVRCESVEETPAGDAIELRKLVIRVHSRPKPETKNRAVSIAEPPNEPAVSDEDEDDETDADSDVKMTSPGPTAPSKPTYAREDTALSPPRPSDGNTATRPEQQEETEEEERIVYHFLYKNWPDFGAPSLDDLDSFFTLMRLSREKNARRDNPRIVHCSAGVGRSGTFIALEHLIRELEAGVLEGYDERVNVAAAAATSPSSAEGGANEGVAGGNGSRAGTPSSLGSGWSGSSNNPAPKPQGPGEDDLILETVDQLREQRRTMVQAESQYLFIYQVLRKLWEDKYGEHPHEGNESGVAPEDQQRPEEQREAGLGGAAGDDGTIEERAAKRLEMGPFAGRE